MGTFKTIASKSSTWVAISLLGLLLACYANSFHGAWQYDDFINIVHNGKIQMTEFSWPQIRKALSAGPEFQIVGRPLAYMSFALNYLWGGDNPLGYHVVNLAIHILASFILFLFVRDTLRLPIFNERYAAHACLIAWLSTLFWACHPIHVTSVTYIVQRMTAMAGLFYVTALYAYLVGRRTGRAKIRRGAYAICAMSAVCALLTKENAVLLPYAIVLYELFFFRSLNRGTVCKAMSISMGVTVLLLLLSYLYTHPMALFEPYPNRSFTMAERVLTQPRVLFIYLGLLAVPMVWRMSLPHDVVVSTSWTNPWSTWVAVIGLLAVLILLCLMARRHRLFAFCGLFFFLNHAVESSILNLELIYEHRNYVPSMLVFVPLAVGIVRAMSLFYYRQSIRILIVGCVGFLLLIRAQTTYEYNRVFASEYTLWRHVALVYPKSSLAHNNLGKTYWYLGESEKSRQSFLKALELDNFNSVEQKSMAYYNLGLYDEKVERNYRKALERYEKARALFSDLSKYWHAIVQVRMKLGDFAGAEEILEAGLKRWPNDQTLHGFRAINQLKKGAYAQAIQMAEASLASQKMDSRVGSMVIAQAHWFSGDRGKAMENWQRLLEWDPQDAVALMAMSEMNERLHQREAASNYMKMLLDLKGVDYLRKNVSFEVEIENIMPYVPDETILNQLAQELGHRSGNAP